MSPLLKIRAERDQMSAIERRIADFILTESHLLRDYSSQQLANALKISQSSVVKFSQKLGFKGYPDLKYSIGESIARGDGAEGNGVFEAPGHDLQAPLGESLWHSKAQAEQETRLINPLKTLSAIAEAVDRAGKVFIIGIGEDAVPARTLALRLSLLGVLTIHHSDAALIAASMDTAKAHDVLFVLSEHGLQPSFSQISRQFHERQGKVISVTRHSANPLRAHATLALLVSAHDERSHIEPLLYQCALQHLLDLIFILLCESGTGRLALLNGNLERIQNALAP